MFGACKYTRQDFPLINVQKPLSIIGSSLDI